MKVTEIRITPLGLRLKEPYHWAGRVDLGSAPGITPHSGKIGLLNGLGLGIELGWDAVAQAAERHRQDEYYRQA
jgi:hypothetical protein